MEQITWVCFLLKILGISRWFFEAINIDSLSNQQWRSSVGMQRIQIHNTIYKRIIALLSLLFLAVAGHVLVDSLRFKLNVCRDMNCIWSPMVGDYRPLWKLSVRLTSSNKVIAIFIWFNSIQLHNNESYLQRSIFGEWNEFECVASSFWK